MAGVKGVGLPGFSSSLLSALMMAPKITPFLHPCSEWVPEDLFIWLVRWA
jgi:hypothetical protein